MNKFEQLVEFIINEDEAKAQELFHEIVVEKSREIYNQLVKEADETDDFVSDIEADEDGDNMDMDDMGDDMDDMSDDMDDMGDDHHADVGGNEEIEDRVVDLEAALDELKAEFDAMMAGDEEEESEEEVEEADDFDFFGESEDDSDDKEDEDMVREYVEKVAAPKGEDHKATSPVAGKNDMGGTTSNMVKGGTENGRTAPKAQQMSTGNKNVPGGKQGLEKAPAPKRGE
jgi:hypothetical protein